MLWSGVVVAVLVCLVVVCAVVLFGCVGLCVFFVTVFPTRSRSLTHKM